MKKLLVVVFFSIAAGGFAQQKSAPQSVAAPQKFALRFIAPQLMFNIYFRRVLPLRRSLPW